MSFPQFAFLLRTLCCNHCSYLFITVMYGMRTSLHRLFWCFSAHGSVSQASCGPHPQHSGFFWLLQPDPQQSPILNLVQTWSATIHIPLARTWSATITILLASTDLIRNNTHSSLLRTWSATNTHSSLMRTWSATISIHLASTTWSVTISILLALTTWSATSLILCLMQN